jgi:hypothetical protein
MTANPDLMAAGRLMRVLLVPVAVYAGWLAMMIVHEGGHVLHAAVSGGVVERVDVPLLGFSQTHFTSNPRPHFVAWGGPVWGCVIPLLLLGVLTRAPRRLRHAAQLFAGFCLIANGAYLGVGWTSNVGDAGDLRSHGTPPWVMITFGVITASAGLFLWHLLGTESRKQPAGGAAA